MYVFKLAENATKKEKRALRFSGHFSFCVFAVISFGDITRKTTQLTTRINISKNAQRIFRFSFCFSANVILHDSKQIAKR